VASQEHGKPLRRFPGLSARVGHGSGALRGRPGGEDGRADGPVGELGGGLAENAAPGFSEDSRCGNLPMALVGCLLEGTEGPRSAGRKLPSRARLLPRTASAELADANVAANFGCLFRWPRLSEDRWGRRNSVFGFGFGGRPVPMIASFWATVCAGDGAGLLQTAERAVNSGGQDGQRRHARQWLCHV